MATDKGPVPGGDNGRGGISVLGQPGVLEGPGYLYRPGQVLVGAATVADHPGTIRQLREAGATTDEELNERLRQAGLGVQAFQLPAIVNIPVLITQLRMRPAGGPVPDVSPNYVLAGEYNYEGGPFDEPHDARPFPDDPCPEPHAPPLIAVLDTGYDPAIHHLHRGLAARIDHRPQDDEIAILPDGYFAQEAGHGTFIDGIVMRLAPDLRIRHISVLSPAGVGDDVTVALGLAHEHAPVVNLSLGGYTHDNQPPTALQDALGKLGDSVAIVAAAGNYGLQEPFWPAAFKGVVAVGALDTTSGQQRRASFSNYGHWVDIYAPGTRVRSTYLRGKWKLPTDPAPWHLGGWAHWSGTSFGPRR